MVIAVSLALLTTCFESVSDWLDSFGMAVGISIRMIFMGFIVLRILIRYLIAPATGGGASDSGLRASRDAHRATNRRLSKRE